MIQHLRILGTILVVTLLTAGIGWGVSVYTDRERLRLENQVLTQNVLVLQEQALDTARALRAEQVRSQKFFDRSQELTEVIEGIIIGGIPDAPLHPDLANRLNGLRPSDKD